MTRTQTNIQPWYEFSLLDANMAVSDPARRVHPKMGGKSADGGMGDL